jgi:hypothetical protein
MNNNNKYHYVMCGFSGVGKSTAEQLHKNVEDWESSAYSHIWKPDEEAYWEKCCTFPKNYIDALVEDMNKSHNKVYLLSCHQEVRDELKERGIKYIIVMPERYQLNEYLKRWLKRGSSADFIHLMNNRWFDMIESCENDDAPKIYLEEHEFINDILPK